MRNTARKVLYFLLITCSSCSSIYRFSVDIQVPAPVTLPIFAQNVLILNNTGVQPINHGIDRTFEGRAIPADYPLSLDSMVWSAIDEIAAVLDESGFFNRISTYRKSLRNDSEWLPIARLSPEVQSGFYHTENFDALLVIERLLFSVKENVKIIQPIVYSYEPTPLIDLRADGAITCSMYYYGKEKPLITFSLSDSMFLKSSFINDSTVLFKTIPELVLDELSRTIGNQAATQFIPTWQTAERMLFVSLNPRMQEAAGYAADHQWAKAESLWKAELEKKTKPTDKAKITFNLAVAAEMQDRFESAPIWVQKAKKYFENANPNTDSQDIKLTNQYISELEKRIQNNRLLDLQWGKE